MKKHVSIYLLVLCCLQGFTQHESVSFSSSDTALQTAFGRAKEMALHYKGKPGDPVGAWYESALPPRAAFCMRDVSHQSIPSEVLGMSDANKNMFTLFAKNISASKDWCSFWEINKYTKPAPEDYRNDTAFWYNLNANFDVMTACWNLYLWTGDSDYINNSIFKNFYNKSANDYILSWALQPDSLFTRPMHPNAGASYNNEDAFHRCRGLASYVESVTDLKMGADLIAAIYRGLLSYSNILSVTGNNEAAKQVASNAGLYQKNIDTYWWDDAFHLYNTYYSNTGKFGKNEGETFLLWFDALKDSSRKTKTIEHLLSGDWNVENMSYFPYLFYKNGYWNEALHYMLLLTNPATPRREYPEVSYGVILGFVKGLMGIEPDARFNRIATIYRAENIQSSTIKNVPALGTTISVTHYQNKSEFANTGKKSIVWRAQFYGVHKEIIVDKKNHKALLGKDDAGNVYSYADVKAGAGKRITAFVK